MTHEELISSGELTPFRGRVIPAGYSGGPLLLQTGRKSTVDVREGAAVRMAIADVEPGVGSIVMNVDRGATLELSLVVDSSFSRDIHVSVGEGAVVRMDASLFASSSTSLTVDMAGVDAVFEFGGMFLATGSEHIDLALAIRHTACRTRSSSMVKGVASSRSVGQFRGLVYVASGAQHTDAVQQSRNIEISGGRIVASPQLEIYADDVACSHGATVGKIDEEAVYYMRQRGIPLDVARRLQIDGFLREVTSRSGMDSVSAWSGELLDAKLGSI